MSKLRILVAEDDISLAHAAEEWVSVSEIERATKVLGRLVTEWFAGTDDLRGDSWRS